MSSRKTETPPQTSSKPKTASPNGSKPSGAPAGAKASQPPVGKNEFGIPDWRLEQPPFHIHSAWVDGEYRYEAVGDTGKPAPPMRPSKYLSKEQSIEILRYMIVNRQLEAALEAMYKQSKVIGGLYLSLGQEATSVASAFALDQDDWLGPMIRNQGSMVVKGYQPRATMMQYMGKGASPTRGRDSGSHFGDPKELNVVAPISHLGDSISVLAGVALGARLQGRHIACMAYIGDGGQSTGPTYEGFNFAAVQRLGVVLLVEHNSWAYSTPAELQFGCKDLADRAIGYGVPGVIVDGTDANQVYDAAHEAAGRARRGEGASMIEAKLMRMKGHAMHDPARYIPPDVKAYWQRRDPIMRMEQYMMEAGWMTEARISVLHDEVKRYIDDERAAAEAAPMPSPEDAGTDVYCDNSIDIPAKYGEVRVQQADRGRTLSKSSASGHYK